VEFKWSRVKHKTTESVYKVDYLSMAKGERIRRQSNPEININLETMNRLPLHREGP
jgi:hypothetical protein